MSYQIDKTRTSNSSTPTDFYGIVNASPSRIENEIDSLRAIEFREMQEEERYIQGLKMQREKIEQFRKEVLKKDQKILVLEEDVKLLRGKRSDIEKLNKEIDNLNEELKSRDLEIEELRENMRKQVADYERSLRELQNIVMKERDEKSKEIRAYREQSKEKSDETAFMMNEVEKYKKLSKENEERLDEEIALAKERDKHANEQLRTWKNFEKMLKDQVAELGHEKSILENVVRELKESNEQLNYNAQKASELEHALSKEKKKNEDLRKSQENIEKENKNLRQVSLQEKDQIEEEFLSLQSDLSRAMELISRQENTIIELRMKSKDDDAMLNNIKDTVFQNESDNKRLNTKLQKLQQELDDVNLKFSKIDSNMMHAKTENLELKKQIQGFAEKEQKEKIERKQFAKMKMNLLTQRNEEVSRLSEAIESFTNNPY